MICTRSWAISAIEKRFVRPRRRWNNSSIVVRSAPIEVLWVDRELCRESKSAHLAERDDYFFLPIIFLSFQSFIEIARGGVEVAHLCLGD
jgi:hypothetical protein